MKLLRGMVKVGFYLKGKEWIPTMEGRRVFNELNGGSVEVISKATPVEHGKVYQSPSGPTMEVDEVQEKPRVAGLLMKSHFESSARDRKSTDRAKGQKA